MLRNIFISVLIICSAGLYAQSSKSHMKAAQQFIANGYHEEAIEQYAKAIEYDPQNGEAFFLRAQSREFLGLYKKAAKDYINAAVFGQSAAENFLKAAELYFQIEEYPLTERTLARALNVKQKYHEAFLLQTKLYLITKRYDQALEAATKAVDAKNSAYALYLKGTVEYKLGNTDQAEKDLEKAVIKDKMLLDAYLALAELQINTGKLSYAIENCNYVIVNDRDNIKAYILRSQAYSQNRQFENAIVDASKAIAIDSAHVSNYVYRGKLYLEYAQFQNAINDFTLALNADMFNQEALELRASAYEKIGQNSLAVSDFALLLRIDEEMDHPKRSYYESKVYELNTENNKPQLSLVNPYLNDDMDVTVPNDIDKVEITTKVEDKSKIKTIRVNNDTLFYDPKGVAPGEFSLYLRTNNLEYLTISATDIYDNTSSISYAVQRIETREPSIALMNPYPGEDGFLSVTSDEKYLYLEGRVEDESQISSIKIDEVTASFAPDDINPRFTATIDITKKNKIRLVATDVHGNTYEKEYIFRRDGRLVSDDTPMGKTWVVLIENSEYKDFSNLRSPEQDMKLMQEALSGYKINKVIVKRNQSKREMERFFSIDLRDLVRTNDVNSILIWFAGHGENINGNGYWIPSDATMDVEFSYFNINALKASLYSYTSLTHMLVVSDACETGPGFVTAMRGPADGISCSDTQFALKKSAQVFTSAGSGYAYDNSLFTRSFANALLNNEDDCATIDDIVKRVSIIIRNNSSQTPEFGRITGIKDEMGTFFFMSR